MFSLILCQVVQPPAEVSQTHPISTPIHPSTSTFFRQFLTLYPRPTTPLQLPPQIHPHLPVYPVKVSISSKNGSLVLPLSTSLRGWRILLSRFVRPGNQIFRDMIVFTWLNLRPVSTCRLNAAVRWVIATSVFIVSPRNVRVMKPLSSDGLLLLRQLRKPDSRSVVLAQHIVPRETTQKTPSNVQQRKVSQTPLN
jgi:hypothetical protein